MSKTIKVQFICVRADHHRRTTRSDVLCEHLGCLSYCPAGDVDRHDWMPALADVASLSFLGYAPPGDDEPGEELAEEHVPIAR